MFAIGMIFLIFLIMYGFRFNRNIELSESEIEINKMNTCLLVSSLMTSAFIGGNGVIINETIDYEVNITEEGYYKELIVANNSYCLGAIHYAQNGNLHKGRIKIKNQNNYVDIENV